MIQVVRIHQLIHRIQIAFVYLFVKPAYKSLVSFGRHGSLLSLHVNRASHVWGSRQRLDAKTPQNEHGGTHYCDADGKKSNSDQALLPWLSGMARSRDWRK